VTTENHSNRFWGITDLKLSEAGLRQAELLHDRLAKEHLDAIYCSKLTRSRKTAEIIAAGHELPLYETPELNECNFGDAEGLTFDEINVRFPDLLQVLLGTDTSTRFPDGESLEDVFQRTGSFIHRLQEHGMNETVCIVGHGTPLQTIICHLLGLSAGFWHRFRIDRASLSTIETYEGGATLTRLNDTGHLNGVN